LKRSRLATCLFLAVRAFAAICAQRSGHSRDALILDRTHESRIFHETRHYRIFLPPAYESSTIRYPVIYWFHGYGERYNKNPANNAYDHDIAGFVAAHNVIVVKWDGYNPRTPNEDYPRPYNIGPVETDRQFPLYFLELVAFIDANYRTIADREHRATSGFSMGGFMSYWIAGKYPDLVSSASSFMGSSEFVVGPRDFPVEYSHDVMAQNYSGVRTRLVTGTRDFIQVYHRQMNLIWQMRTHETENFESDHGTPGMAKTLAFHMNAFANPLPRPDRWSHADVYPNFSVWDWTVESDRHQPGFTTIGITAPDVFWTEVREWLPRGKILSDVHLKITTAPLYKKNTKMWVTLGGAKSPRRLHLKTDSAGRLQIELPGEFSSIHTGLRPLPISEPPYQAPVPHITDFQIADRRTFTVFQHAIEKQQLTLGKGNGDGHANPGEEIAILLPDGDAYRAAELFSIDSCADLTHRVSDNWGSYDHVGASAKYTLLKIAGNCPAGHIIKLNARIVIPDKPNHQVRTVAIELPII
jgi:poly(3-hydroxybutyrate) depolymerase